MKYILILVGFIIALLNDIIVIEKNTKKSFKIFKPLTPIAKTLMFIGFIISIIGIYLTYNEDKELEKKYFNESLSLINKNISDSIRFMNIIEKIISTERTVSSNSEKIVRMTIDESKKTLNSINESKYPLPNSLNFYLHAELPNYLDEEIELIDRRYYKVLSKNKNLFYIDIFNNITNVVPLMQLYHKDSIPESVEQIMNIGDNLTLNVKFKNENQEILFSGDYYSLLDSKAIENNYYDKYRSKKGILLVYNYKDKKIELISDFKQLKIRKTINTNTILSTNNSIVEIDLYDASGFGKDNGKHSILNLKPLKLVLHTYGDLKLKMGNFKQRSNSLSSYIKLDKTQTWQ